MNIITLSNADISVRIAPDKGSNMFAFTYKGHEIIYHEPELLESCGFTGNFVLFPTPNRVENATYSWNGRVITQKKNGVPVLIHGLVFDEQWKVTQQSQTSVTTSISLTEPFVCTLRLTYSLKQDGIRITYSVINDGDERMPFGFALHPYFSRLSGDDQTYITIPAKSWMESPTDTLLPTGKLIDVSDKPYNVLSPRPIGELSLDHVYTDLIPNEYATIDYSTMGMRVTLKTSDDFTHMVVYTGHKGAVCIENQTCSTNAINLYNRGLTKESHLLVLEPGATHTGFVCYEISHLWH